MGRFEALLSTCGGLDPKGQQDCIHERLPSVASLSHLHYWRSGDPIPKKGVRTLIGIGVYVPAQLTFLDRLDELVAREERYSSQRADIFSIFDVKDNIELDNILPGIGTVKEVPIVGLCEDGELKECAWGPAGKDLLRRIHPELKGVRIC